MTWLRAEAGLYWLAEPGECGTLVARWLASQGPGGGGTL
jgi:hypothetical protein